jgi:ABC-2 type transport system permease protein
MSARTKPGSAGGLVSHPPPRAQAGGKPPRYRASWLANPLAAKELRGRMRGPRAFVVATLYLLPLGALTVVLYWVVAASTTGNLAAGVPVGKLFFAAVSALELGLICLLAPALTADLISGERERRTYELLLVTPLTGGQIVVGKLVAALGSLVLLVVLALPLQTVAILLGGVGPEELLVGFAILVLTTLTYGCVGLYWSARLRSTRAAVALAYGTTVLGVLGLPLAFLLMAVATQIFGTPNVPILRAVVGGGGAFASPLEAQALTGIGQLLAATNPALTGILSAALLAQGRELIFDERIGGHDVTIVAPWLLFSVIHAVAIALLILLTARALRRGNTAR